MFILLLFLGIPFPLLRNTRIINLCYARLFTLLPFFLFAFFFFSFCIVIIMNYMAYAPPKFFPPPEPGLFKDPPASFTRRQASPRASPLCPYLHNASSAFNLGIHLGSRFGSQFFVSASNCCIDFYTYVFVSKNR